MSAMAKYRDICTVAVLPFLNETSQKTAGMQAMRIFTNELIASGNYQVIPEGEIAFFMQRNRLLPIDLLNSDLYSKLARKLALDAVIRGRVMSLGQQQNVGGVVPYLSMQIDLYAADSGELIAHTYNRRQGDDYQKVLHYGTIHTTSGLISEASREIIYALKEEGLSHCPEK
jgi:hypothetical protein